MPTTSPRELSTITGPRSTPRNGASAAWRGRGLPSSDFSAKPVPSGAIPQSRPSAPPFATQPGRSDMRSVSSEPSPPTSSGRARMAASTRSAPSISGKPANAAAMRSSVIPKVTTPQPSTAVGTSSAASPATAATSAMQLAAAADGRRGGSPPSPSRARGRQRGSPRASRSSCDGSRPAAALLLAALEVVLGRRRLREQAAHGLDLRRLGAVRRAGDGDLPCRRGRAGRGRAGAPGSASRSSGRGRRAPGRRRPRPPRRRGRRRRERGGAPRPCLRGARIR